MRRLTCLVGLGLLVISTSLVAQDSLTATVGTPKLDGTASPGEWTSGSITTEEGLTIRAMIDDEYIWILAQWEDATLSVGKNQLMFDGATWTSGGDEDRVGIIWDMGETGDDGASCFAFCHGDSMATNGGRVDVWHWKAARSNPVGFLDDKWWDEAGRHGDEGSGIDSRNRIEDGLPQFMAAEGPDWNPDYLLNDPSAVNRQNPFGAVDIGSIFGLAVAHDPGAVFSAGATIPGRILKLPGGSRSDVRAAGHWEDGVWTVEFCRKRIASDDDFEALSGTSVEFTTEIFDNVGDDHWQDGFDTTVYTLHIPSPTNYHSQFANGGGLISEGVVSNPFSDEQVSGTVSFFDDDGNPMPVEIISSAQDQVVVALGAGPAQEASVDFLLEPLGTLTLSSDGVGEVVVGSAVVTSDQRVSSVVRFNLPGTGVAGVGTSEPLTGFITPVRDSNGVRTGVALHNPGDKAITMTLTLRDDTGVVVAGGVVEEALPAHGHVSMFIDEFFPDADTTGLVGTLTVEVKDQDGLVAGTAIEMGSLPGEFTTLPVTPLG